MGLSPGQGSRRRNSISGQGAAAMGLIPGHTTSSTLMELQAKAKKGCDAAKEAVTSIKRAPARAVGFIDQVRRPSVDAGDGRDEHSQAKKQALGRRGSTTEQKSAAAVAEARKDVPSGGLRLLSGKVDHDELADGEQVINDNKDLDNLLLSLRSQDGARANWRQRQEEAAKNRWIIHPDNTYRQRWDVMILVIVLFTVMTLPLRLAFSDILESPGQDGLSWMVTDIVSDAIFGVDMLLNFRTGYFNNKGMGELVMSTRDIGQHYLRTWFLLDLLPLLQLDRLGRLLGPSSSSEDDDASGDDVGSLYRVLRLFKVFKLLRVIKMSSYVKKVEKMLKLNLSLVRLVKLLVAMLLVCHWLGCLWWFIAMWTREDIKAGMYDNETAVLVAAWGPSALYLDDAKPLGTKYLVALWWAVSACTGLDVTQPATDAQYIYSIMVAYIGVTMVSIVIGQASSLLSNLDMNATKRQQRLESISQYMRYRRVPPRLSARITSYFEYLWTRMQSLDDKALLGELPYTLQLQLALVLNRTLFTRVPLFSKMQTTCIVAFVQKMRPMIAMPQQVVVQHGAQGSALYFVSRGELHVKDKAGGIVEELGDNDFFGEKGLLLDQASVNSVMAVDYCDLMYLHKDDFRDVMGRFPEVKELVEEFSEKGRSRRRGAVGGAMPNRWALARTAPGLIRSGSFRVPGERSFRRADSFRFPAVKRSDPDSFSRKEGLKTARSSRGRGSVGEGSGSFNNRGIERSNSFMRTRIGQQALGLAPPPKDVVPSDDEGGADVLDATSAAAVAAADFERSKKNRLLSKMLSGNSSKVSPAEQNYAVSPAHERRRGRRASKDDIPLAQPDQPSDSSPELSFGARARGRSSSGSMPRLSDLVNRPIVARDFGRRRSPSGDLTGHGSRGGSTSATPQPQHDAAESPPPYPAETDDGGAGAANAAAATIDPLASAVSALSPRQDGDEDESDPGSDATLDDEPICSDCDAAQGLSQEGRHSGGDAEPFIVGESSGGAGADVLNMGAATTTAKAPTPKKAAEAAGASGMRSRVGLEFIGD